MGIPQKTIKVEFYQKSIPAVMYTPELLQPNGSRTRREEIAWDTVLEICTGTWINSSFRQNIDLGRS